MGLKTTQPQTFDPRHASGSGPRKLPVGLWESCRGVERQQVGRKRSTAGAMIQGPIFPPKRLKADSPLAAQLQTFSSEPKVQCQVIGTVLAN